MGKMLESSLIMKKRDILARLIAKETKVKEIGKTLGMDFTSIFCELKKNRTKVKDVIKDDSLWTNCLFRNRCAIKKVYGLLTCGQKCNGCFSAYKYLLKQLYISIICNKF